MNKTLSSPFPAGMPVSSSAWGELFPARFRSKQPDLLLARLPALQAYPTDSAILLLVAIAALIDERPEQSLRYLHRFNKHFAPDYAEDNLL